MMRTIALALVLAVIWLLNSGHYSPLLLELLLLSVAFVVFIAHRMDMIDHESIPLRIVMRTVPYFWWLFKQLVLSNIDVVKRIWAGPGAVDPVMAVMPIRQKTDIGRVILANSITLTPGTIALALSSDSVTVHALSAQVWESLRDGEMDQRVRDLER
jgi:multicomponent Na+:H+ antiporter subunit E